jgi:two-component system phosphate regulon response regulator PhoB
MDGLEVCRQIRKSKEHINIPIIMLTALGEKEDLLKGFEAGADDYLSKPIDRQILIARVHAMFRRIEIDTNEIIL